MSTRSPFPWPTLLYSTPLSLSHSISDQDTLNPQAISQLNNSLKLDTNMAMEEGKISSSSSSQSNSTGGNARWTPTKDQIAVLENLYKQGVRTPTAEQIQQITGKLREFGSIEGKNVFYWFQNHKARQRQKQKQQTFAYYSKLIKRAHPGQVLAPVAPMHQLPNAAVSPQPVACNGVVIFRPTMYPAPQPGSLNYYKQPQTQAQTQAQYSAMFNPEPTKMSPSHVFQSQNLPPKHALQTSNNCYHSDYASVSNAETGAIGKETLQLFPLHPANRRCERSGGSVTSDLAEVSERVDEEGEEEVGCEHQHLFDFLGALNG